jgi:hypothetical protein
MDIDNKETPATPETPEVVTPPVVTDTPPPTPVVPTAEEVANAKRREKNTLLREMSKEHGVDLFTPEGLKAFKQYQDDQLTDNEKLTTRIKEFETSQGEHDSKLQTTVRDYESKIAALEYNVDPANMNDVMTLASAMEGEDIKANIKAVIDKHPHFVKEATTVKQGISTQDKLGDKPLLGEEAQADLIERAFGTGKYRTGA